jgi:uncharacterized protein CbrC (UPF0167 family)
MAGEALTRARQMVAVAEARTKRAADTALSTRHAVEAARDALCQAEATRALAQAAADDAAQLLKQSPGSEQHRLWLDHCRARCAFDDDAVKDAQEALGEAEEAHQRAMAIWQRQQRQQEHLNDHSQGLTRDAARIAERRAEDELQGSSIEMAAL